MLTINCFIFCYFSVISPEFSALWDWCLSLTGSEGCLLGCFRNRDPNLAMIYFRNWVIPSNPLRGTALV